MTTTPSEPIADPALNPDDDPVNPIAPGEPMPGEDPGSSPETAPTES